MFIHWGLYALAARHEWVMQKEHMTVEQYRKYFEMFEADLFDADEWAHMAADAGMKYVVFTTKHHDGFCLWDTAHTEYKSTRAPIGRDVVREVVEAFRKRGLKIGLYHSLIDWSHPTSRWTTSTPSVWHPTATNSMRAANRAATPSTCTLRCASCFRITERST
jgi:alpha-L-fucosidase